MLSVVAALVTAVVVALPTAKSPTNRVVADSAVDGIRSRTALLVRKSRAIGSGAVPVCLNGMLRTGAGTPVANATVRFGGGETVRTGDHGEFSILFDAPAHYRLDVEWKGHQQELSVGVEGCDDSYTELIVSIPTIVVYVIGGNAPLADALVEVDGASYATDIDGRAVVGVPRAGILRVVAAGWPTHVQDVIPVAPQPDLYVHLRRGVKVSGRVLLSNGDGWTGVQVEISDAATNHVLHRVYANEDGYWAVDCLASGVYNARVPSVTQLLVVTGRPIDDLVLRAAPLGVVAGRVTDSYGSPAGGVVVTLAEASGASSFAVSSKTGFFRVEHVKHGYHTVFGRASNLASRPQQVLVSGEVFVDVRLVDSYLRGVVLNLEGEPQAGVMVRARATTDGGGPPLTRRTDVSGRFEFAGVEQPEYMLDALLDDSALSTLNDKTTVHRVPAENVVVRVRSAATLSGRVLFEGKPLGNFAMLLGSSSVHPDVGAEPIQVNNPRGEFEVLASPGVWTLSIKATRSRLKVLPAVRLAWGSRVHVGDVQLERAPQAHGRVLDETGAPVFGAQVYLGRADGPSEVSAHSLFAGNYVTQTGVDGTFSFEAVDPWSGLTQPPWIVAEHAVLGRSLRVHVRETSYGETLHLRATGAVECFLDPALGTVLVEISRFGRSRVEAAQYARHVAVFPAIPAGTYTVTVTPRGGDEMRSSEVSVLARSVATIKF